LQSEVYGEQVCFRSFYGEKPLGQLDFRSLYQSALKFAQYLNSHVAYRNQMFVCLDIDQPNSLLIALFGTLLANGVPELPSDKSSFSNSQAFYVDDSIFAEAVRAIGGDSAPIDLRHSSRAVKVFIEDAKWIARGDRFDDLSVEVWFDHEQLIARAKNIAKSLALSEGERLVLVGQDLSSELLLLSCLASLLVPTSIDLFFDDPEMGLPSFAAVLAQQPNVVVSSLSYLQSSRLMLLNGSVSDLSDGLRAIVPIDICSTQGDLSQVASLLQRAGLKDSLLCPLYGLQIGAAVLTAPFDSAAPRDVSFRKKQILKRGVAREFVSRSAETELDDSDTLKFTCLGVPHRSDHIRIADRFGKEVSDSELGELQFQLPYERGHDSADVPEGVWCTRGERGFFYRGELYLVPSSLDAPFWLSWLRGRGHALRWYTAAAFLVPIGVVCILSSPTCRIARLVAKFFARSLFALGGTPLSLSYAVDLDRSQAQILVANHASFLDAIALTALLPVHVSYAVKKELATGGIASVVLRKLEAAFVERFSAEDGFRDIESMQKRVESGETFVFFPEGTFTRRSELSAFRLGAFKIAAEVGCPVVPLVIRGSRSVVRDVQFAPRPGKIEVEVLSPYSVAATDWNSLCDVRNEVRSAIAESCGEPDALKLL
jgi:1-acyl-sn-glycerol-3-phosphate acyltransferase